MICKIKYTAFVILCLTFLLFCGETAGQTIADRTDASGERIVFSRIYDTEMLKNDISELADKYTCKGFVLKDSYSDSIENIYYLLPNSEDMLKQDIGIKECSFNTITGPEVKLTFKTFDEIADDIIIGSLFISGDSNESFISALTEKYEFTVEKGEKAFPMTLAAGTVCTVLFLLLCLYDVLSKKKDVCISLTLGTSLMAQIVHFAAKDILFYVVCAPAVFALLYKITAAALFIKVYVLFVSIQTVCSALMYFALFGADICLTLKNKNGSNKLLAFNYLLKTVSCTILIAALMFSGEIGSQLLKSDNAHRFSQSLGEFSIIDLQASAYQVSKMDELFSQSEVIELVEGSPEQQEANGYNDDVAILYDECDKNGDIFFLNAISPAFKVILGKSENDGPAPNIIYASDSAREYISSVTGTAPDEENISILFPKHYSHTDKELAELFVSMYDEGYISLNYTSADIACFGAQDRESLIPSSRRLSFLSDPIIVFFPLSQKYNYLDYDLNFAVNIDKNTVLSIIDDKDLKCLKTDFCSVSYCADKFTYDAYSQALLYGIIIAAIAVYSLIIFVSTVVLDIELHRRDRAISLVLGEGFIKRCSLLIESILLSGSISCIGAACLCGAIGYNNYLFIILTGALVLTFDLLFALTAIRINEKKEGYTLTSLKGGAL